MRDREAIQLKLSEIEAKRTHYLAHQEVLMRRQDQHGVMDAAADIRELQAMIDALDWVLDDTDEAGVVGPDLR